MTRILVVGDTHGNMDWFVMSVLPYAVEQRVDKIVQVGDFGFVWPRPNYLRGLDKLSRLLDRHSIDLHFLPGNHEDYSKLELLSARCKTLSTEGHFQLRPHLFYTGKVSAWEWDGRRIAVVGGATSIDKQWRVPGKSWWEQEALTPAEAEAAKAIGPVEVLFSHDAPVANPFDLKRDLDSLAHRQVITDVARVLQPRLWFHGHYHVCASYGFRHDGGETSVFSLGCDGRLVSRSTAVLDLQVVSEPARV